MILNLHSKTFKRWSLVLWDSYLCHPLLTIVLIQRFTLYYTKLPILRLCLVYESLIPEGSALVKPALVPRTLLLVWTSASCLSFYWDLTGLPMGFTESCWPAISFTVLCPFLAVTYWISLDPSIQLLRTFYKTLFCMPHQKTPGTCRKVYHTVPPPSQERGLDLYPVPSSLTPQDYC